VGAALARLGEMPAELLGRADALMYQSKRNGRNRAEVE
jgi:PleD family two-component response regulator